MFSLNKKGLTLVELILVIIILGLISIITVSTVNAVTNKAKRETFVKGCKNIYKAAQIYKVDSSKEDNCVVFEFNSDRKKEEIIDDVKYMPVSKLNLEGKNPTNGKAVVCNGNIEVAVDNEKYTCIINKDAEIILDGKVEENDITRPIINDVVIESTNTSIKLEVEASEDKGIIDKYIFKSDGMVIDTTDNIYVFEDLVPNKKYRIEVQVQTKTGLKSLTTIKYATTN